MLTSTSADLLSTRFTGTSGYDSAGTIAGLDEYCLLTPPMTLYGLELQTCASDGVVASFPARKSTHSGNDLLEIKGKSDDCIGEVYKQSDTRV